MRKVSGNYELIRKYWISGKMKNEKHFNEEESHKKDDSEKV